VTANGVSDYRHYIYGGGKPIAVYSRKSTGVTTLSYLLTDHQGSVSAITNSSGAIDVAESYTAFGTRRNPATWSGAPAVGDQTTSAGITRQGYTFQTALGVSMGLNHMNGRVQDAILGRFISPDPSGTSANNTQSWNRYSYVLNNPLSYVDPTGHSPSDPKGDDGGDGEGDTGGDTGGDDDEDNDEGFGATSPNGSQTPGNVPPPQCSPAGCLIYTQSCVTGGPCVTNAQWWASIGPALPTIIFNGGSSVLTTPDGSGGGGGGGGTTGSTSKTQTGNQLPEVVVQAQKWLCTAGNLLAEGADKLGNVSGKLELVGLGVAGFGFAIAQPEVVAPGLTLAATGGAGNIGAGALQLTAGLLQGAGGGGFGNAGYGALSLVTGYTLSRGIVGPTVSGYRTVSQRTAAAFTKGTATITGGVNDIWTSLIDAASPQQVTCPGGN
jgi:RHS repeat-associated protein